MLRLDESEQNQQPYRESIMHNKEEIMPFEDALAEAWLKPDIMESFIAEFKAAREHQFAEIEIAKEKGQDVEWLLGKMLAFSQVVDNLQQCET